MEQNIYLLNTKGKKLKGFPVSGSEYSVVTEGKKVLLFVRDDAHTIKSYKVEE